MAKAKSNIFANLLKRKVLWLSSWPNWLKFTASVFGVSLLTSLLLLGVYDQFWGSSPISKKSRLVTEALAICNKAQELAHNPVDLKEWPLKDNFNIAVLGDAAGFAADPASYAKETTTSEDIYKATIWLTEKYGASMDE